MAFHIAICDDEAASAEYIRKLTAKWAGEKGYAVEMELFPSAEAFLFQYEEEKKYDILLLDVEMGDMNGVELARKIRRGNREVQIVFITGYMEYISDGYEVEALHYLMKPVRPEKLGEVLTRAVEKLKKNEQALLLEGKDEMIRVPFYEIRYLEVQKNYVTVHAEEDYTVKRTLRELETELDDSFCRTGRSYLVNLQFVRRITRTEVILKDDTALPVSRGMYEPLNRAMIRYF
ncbi:MAG TPA: DNA-binding response regulator [Lachnospiraceae bacterium]|nr:DNA-binding response regulator [Lachnospiraceae bacterium]